MALYEYHCDKCGNTFEKRMPMSAVRQRVACPKCKKQAKKLMGTFAITGKAVSYDIEDYGGDGDEAGGGHDHGHDHGHSHGMDPMAGMDDLDF